MQKAENIIVIFGATGDLMTRKIAPSLYSLYEEGGLERTAIIGFSRREYSAADFHDFLREPIQKKNETTDENLNSFFECVDFVSGNFNDNDAYHILVNKIREVTDDNCSPKVYFYLAIPPEFYDTIIPQISSIKHKILENCELNDFRLLVEKPIGTDLESALRFEDMFAESFSEIQIYRIDHYLQKNSTRNIFAFRFLNKIFQPSWNNQTIERIEIVTNEHFDVSDRGKFYDSTGTLRDVGQNHLLELLALLTMKKPETFSATNIAKARSEAIKKIRCLKESDIANMTYRAQYNGFQEIEDVQQNSDTETFFKIQTSVEDQEWYNVPIMLQAGKALSHTEKYVKVVFRKDLGERYDMREAQQIQNQIVFNLPPKEYINIEFSLFADSSTGLSCEIKEASDVKQYIEEYKEVFRNAIGGDKTWFVTKEEVIAGWEFVDPIIKSWNKGIVNLDRYDIGTNTPIENSNFLSSKGSSTENLKKQIGIIGLGKMGGNIARNFIDHDWEVVAYNRTPEKTTKMQEEGAIPAYDIQELIEKLERPRKIWLMVPSGKPVDDVLFGENGLIHLLEEGDIIIDAGNSFFKNSIERANRLKEKGIKFVDAGVSGGPSGARNGACIMIGGEKETFEYLEPVFMDICLSGGYKFFEGNGAGHFVKMIHNGIEYGMMQSIAEGFNIFKASDYEFNLKKIAEVYNRGSVVESRLVGWLLSAYEQNSTNLNEISGSVQHSGEGQWTVEIAREMNIPAKVIEDALQFRIDSVGNPSYIGQIISALRNQFGGHDVDQKS